MNYHDHHPAPHDAMLPDGPRKWSDEQLLLTAEQAARALHVGRTTLYALIKDGQLRAVHIGRSCRLTRAELLRYIHQLERPASSTENGPPTNNRARPRAALHQTGLFDLDPAHPTPPRACLLLR